MLQGSGHEAASAAAEQQAGSQPGGASSTQSSGDLWKDVPGFAAGDSWFSAERGTADRGKADRGTQQGPSSDDAGSRQSSVQWQPRDPWRDEVVTPAASAATGAGSKDATDQESNGVDEAIRGFNNDPARAGPVGIGPSLAPSVVDDDAVSSHYCGLVWQVSGGARCKPAGMV